MVACRTLLQTQLAGKMIDIYRIAAFAMTSKWRGPFNRHSSNLIYCHLLLFIIQVLPSFFCLSVCSSFYHTLAVRVVCLGCHGGRSLVVCWLPVRYSTVFLFFYIVVTRHPIRLNWFISLAALRSIPWPVSIEPVTSRSRPRPLASRDGAGLIGQRSAWSPWIGFVGWLVCLFVCFFYD